MSQTSLSVWFVCKLCRGYFGQVDAFIEHKKEKHFNEFQSTNCIVFEEREHGLLFPVTTNEDYQIADESTESKIKIEVNDEEPNIPFSSEIIDEPNLDLVEPKSELITYESETNAVNEDSFFGLKQSEQNPYVLLKRLTTEEIQRACVPQHHSSLFKCEQKIFASGLELPNSSDAGSNSYNHNEIETTKENPSTAPVIQSSRESDQLFECKLCSKQLQSDAELKIHVGICALYHEDRNRFCVICNRKYCDKYFLKEHRLRFHGTEEEKLSLFKFKCHVCSKQFRDATYLGYHLETHKKKKQKKVETSTQKPLKCSHPNCVTEFRSNSLLQTHIDGVHLGLRPFSCSFPNCNKTFSKSSTLKRHLRIHTGERPFKCTVDKCNKAFRTSQHRSLHHQGAHSNL